MGWLNDNAGVLTLGFVVLTLLTLLETRTSRLASTAAAHVAARPEPYIFVRQTHMKLRLRNRRRSGPTPALIGQARRVAELIEAGYSHSQIAEQLGVSGPRVSQIRKRLPELEDYLGNPEPTLRLRSTREQLWVLRREVLTLAATVRRDLRELDEELEAADIDRVLGLRA